MMTEIELLLSCYLRKSIAFPRASTPRSSVNTICNKEARSSSCFGFLFADPFIRTLCNTFVSRNDSGCLPPASTPLSSVKMICREQARSTSSSDFLSLARVRRTLTWNHVVSRKGPRASCAYSNRCPPPPRTRFTGSWLDQLPFLDSFVPIFVPFAHS